MTRLKAATMWLGGFWASVRPRTRRGALRGTAIVAGLAMALSVALYGAFAVGITEVAPYLERTLHPEWNAQEQAGSELTFAGAATCGACHQAETTRLVTSKHAAIGCESCHGALNQHASSSPGPDADLLIATPTDELCVKCHEVTAGRPVSFPQVEPTAHFTLECLACHNPHSGVSMKPPVVQHPLEGLPLCMTCHAQWAFEARDIRHPDASTDDQACLACHTVKKATSTGVKP